MSDSPNARALTALQYLMEVVAKLRSPDGGCPWDLAQTPETLIPYILEEAYETVEAIRSGEQKAIAEELGDLLLQIILQSQIASESQEFTFAEVAEGIAQKLIRRHPHVFADVKVANAAEVHQNWQQIKAAEKGENPAEAQKLSRQLSRYHRTLPPIMAAMKISQKAAGAGFEWDNVEGVWAKFQEELAEFQAALQADDKEHQQEELGDLLFTIINIARWYQLDPAAGLQGTNHRFITRLQKMEAMCDRPLTDYSLDQLEQFWQQAKTQLRDERKP